MTSLYVNHLEVHLIMTQEVLLAGQGASSGPLDNKGVSIEAKRQAAIRRQQQRREAAAAACRHLNFGQS